MATVRWIGASANIRQINTLTIANTWANADTATLTIASVDFVVTIGTLVTTAQVATTIQQALSGTAFTDTTATGTISTADGGAALIPQFSEFTATVASSVVTLTSNQSSPAGLAGKPFTITVTGDGTAGNGTATMATSVTSTSQFHADQVDNYSGNAVPANNDTLVFDSGSIDVRYSLSLGVQLTALTKTKQYTGNVGLRSTNSDNTAKTYSEYRTPAYLTTNNNSVTTTVSMEVGDGPGSGMFKYDSGAGQIAMTIYGHGVRLDQGTPCTIWKGSHASNTVVNLAGDFGAAFYAGETATIATLVTGDSAASQASTYCGSGVTLTTVTLNGGSQETNSAITAGTQNAGAWIHRAGTVTALTVNGGVFYPTGSATITTLTINTGGAIDCTRGGSAFTVTNTIQLTKGSRVIDPQGRMGNFAFKLNNCGPQDVTIITPYSKTFTLS